MARSGKPRRPGRPPGPATDPDRRRAELLDAAAAAVRRVGPDARMEDLAAEAGVTKPVLYHHFGDRAGLVAALADRFSADLAGRLTAAIAGAADVQTATRAAIGAFVDAVDEDPQLYRLVTTSGNLLEPGLVHQPLVKEVAARIAQLLGSALRQADADSGPAEAWGYGVLGLVFAATEWWLDRRTMAKADLVDYLCDLLWEGLAGAGLDRLAPPMGLVDLVKPPESSGA